MVKRPGGRVIDYLVFWCGKLSLIPESVKLTQTLMHPCAGMPLRKPRRWALPTRSI